MQTLLCGGKPCLTMEAPHTSSTSTCSSLLTFSDSDEYDDRNVWNLMLNLFFVMNMLAQSWSHTLMKPCWGESHPPVTLRSTYYVTRPNFIIVQRFGPLSRHHCPLGVLVLAVLCNWDQSGSFLNSGLGFTATYILCSCAHSTTASPDGPMMASLLPNRFFNLAPLPHLQVTSHC